MSNEQQPVQAQYVKPKKPWYKKWWIWVIVGFVVLALIMPSRDRNAVIDATASPEPTSRPWDATAKPTDTPIPTSTPIPIPTGLSDIEIAAWNAVVKKYDEVENIELTANDDLVCVVYGIGGWDEKSIKMSICNSAIDLLKSTQNHEYGSLLFTVKNTLIDIYGNEFIDRIMYMEFSSDTRHKLNIDNILRDNIPIIADKYWEHTVFLQD